MPKLANPAHPLTLTFALFLAVGLAACSDNKSDPLVQETFTNPPELRSVNGELRTSFVVANATFGVAGQTVTSSVYNGSYIPPVLRLRPGDTLYLDLDNRISDSTNLHYHGLNVSPRINANGTVSDNIFVLVDPGARLNYQVAIPGNHNPGMYWYHTHRHELAQRQVMSGLSGGLVIDGILDPFPQLAGIKERIMLLKDIQITAQGTVPSDIDPSAPSSRTVNGQTNPTLTINPGETQFLRFANVGSDVYYRLKLDGHVFYEIARDGNRHNQLITYDELLLPPASRSEVLIQGAERGLYLLRALAFDTGPVGDSYPEATLATLVSQGTSQVPISLALVMPTVEDFRTLPVARKRTITFDESADGNTFYVDSGDGPKQFDPNRIDSTIEIGTVEEWTVLNATQELHVFHIHQTDFQIVEINGEPQPFVGHRDNVNVPFQADDSSPAGQVKILIDFRNPIILGKFVYHCHILEHEDGGMMATAEVVPTTMGRSARALLARAGEVIGTALRGNARAAHVTERDLDAAARADRTLEAIQAGSYCAPKTNGAVTVTASAQPANASTIAEGAPPAKPVASPEVTAAPGTKRAAATARPNKATRVSLPSPGAS